MPGEVTIPILPCRVLDESISFYRALGFAVTYRQRRPNPYAVVRRDDIHIHLFELEGFDPETSYGSVIIAVPDADALYESFVEGLRTVFGRLPSTGIPRIIRPRPKFGTVRGFSVVDTGGNWLRVSTRGDTEEDAAREKTTGLARVIDNAARLGDSKGDDEMAMHILDGGLARFVDAPAGDRIRALAYRAELAVRLGDRPAAEASLKGAEAELSRLGDREPVDVSGDLAHARELVGGLARSGGTPRAGRPARPAGSAPGDARRPSRRG